MDDQKKLSLIKLSGKLSKKNWPQFQCPNCGNYSQKLTNLSSTETQESIAAHREEWWEPEMIEGNFAAISTCLTCKEKVYITGGYGVNEYVNDEGDEPHLAYEEEYSIKFIVPSITLLKLPSKCPGGVKAYINAAAEVIFVSPDLASNRIRTSIDALLTDQKIPRYTTTTRRKKIKLSTHKRIGLYASKNAEAAQLLEAVKWIGNEGTHNNALEVGELLEGLEIYSLSLDLIYDSSKATIRKKASEINKKKGVKKVLPKI